MNQAEESQFFSFTSSSFVSRCHILSMNFFFPFIFMHHQTTQLKNVTESKIKKKKRKKQDKGKKFSKMCHKLDWKWCQNSLIKGNHFWTWTEFLLLRLSQNSWCISCNKMNAGLVCALKHSRKKLTVDLILIFFIVLIGGWKMNQRNKNGKKSHHRI